MMSEIPRCDYHKLPECYRFQAMITNHPIVTDDSGIIRYKQNAAVRWIVDRIDLNQLWYDYQVHKHITLEDMMQLYRDMGYSLSGYLDIFGDQLEKMENDISLKR